ncbi:MAG: hypothetical protein JWP94_3693 [Mucilaginibacter sp.]|nr:hypothetical protein [Mucilaginibacter sp.]
MKNKYIYRYGCMILFLSTVLCSCKKASTPSAANNFLNYTIPEVPVTQNYVVGAFYTNFGTLFPANSIQVPTVGKYGFASGTPPAAVMQAQIDQAGVAKLDYLVFSLRSPTLDNGNFKTDSNTIVSFLAAPNAANMHFAVSYNLSTGTLGITNSGGTTGNGVTLETNAAKLLGFYNDIKRLSYWMTKSNYQKVNGKYMLIINNAQDLNSKDNVALYQQVRTNLSALGFDLYIVGMQQQWSPPQRYYYRFKNCVDAMYEANMGNVNNDTDRAFEFPTMCDQNFAYWKQMIESWNMEFIPCIQAAYNNQVNSPTSTVLSFVRTNDGSFYHTFTNIAKRNASKSRLIFVDSFNNYSFDTQIESTQAYGTTFLDLTRTAFKTN